MVLNMEAVSSFIATVTPPPFQAGAEEAKKTANARDTIPQTAQAAKSANTGVAADGRGATSGANSQLYAQSDALISASTRELREKKKTSKEEKRVDSRKAQDADSKRAAETTKTSSSNASVKAQGSNGPQQTGTAGNGAQIQSAQRVGAVTREGSGFSGARFSETANSHLGEENMTRSSVIANRYNTAFNAQYLGKGQNINYSI